MKSESGKRDLRTIERHRVEMANE